MTSPYYADEHVTLWHGDCLELADKWTGADVLVTDPPYGIGWKGTSYKTASVHPGIANDESVRTRDAALTVWGDDPGLVFGDVLQPFPDCLQTVLVYQKPPDAGIFGKPIGWRKDWEPIFVVGAWPRSTLRLTSVIRTSAPSLVSVAARRYPKDTGAGHPHAKPLDVMETLITNCPPGVIADPFAGSGATLVAARNLGRTAVGVELDERYCEIIATRLSQGALNFAA